MFWRHWKALRQLEDRVEQLERESKALQLEWTEVYDKVRHTLGRLAKRQARVDEDEARAPHGLDAPGPAGQMQPFLPGTDPISQQILRRRRRVVGQGGNE